MFKIARVFNLEITKLFGRTLKRFYSVQNNDSTVTDDTTNIEPTVIVEKDANITLIGINRVASRNSIDSITAQKLINVFHEFESDDASPVAVLYGIGGSFCAGHDIVELQQQLDQNTLEFLLRHEGSIGPTRRHLQKPVICAINGYCVGSGLELALMCDLRVMEDTAILGFFNRRLGVPLSDGGTLRLAASVGVSHALDLLATGRRVNGREALKIGLINRLVATGTALGQAVNLAFSIEKFPRISLQHDRGNILNFYNKSHIRNGTQNEVTNWSDALITEMKEGMQRFIASEKGHGAKTHNWNIREKYIPEWEKIEIELEKKWKRQREENSIQEKTKT